MDGYAPIQSSGLPGDGGVGLRRVVLLLIVLVLLLLSLLLGGTKRQILMEGQRVFTGRPWPRIGSSGRQ